MVIQCPECNTRFKLADDKLKPEGTKVRCSKCRHIFTVVPDTPADEGPSETATDFSFGDFGGEEQDVRSDDFAAGFSPESGEWERVAPGEVNESPETGGAAGDPFAEAEDEGPAGPSEFSFDDTASEDAGSDSSFDFGNAGGGPVEFSFGDEDEGQDTTFSWDVKQEEETRPDPASRDAAGDQFDFSGMTFGEDSPPPAVRAEEPLAPPPREEGGKPSPRNVRKRSQPLPSRRKKKSAFSGLLKTVLVLLLLLCGVAAGYYFWQGGSIDVVGLFNRVTDKLSGGSSPAEPTGQVTVSELEGNFLQNKEAGTLFVVRGKATNGYPGARSAIALKGILYNTAGQPVLQQTVFAGNSLSDESLATMPFARIQDVMNNQFGDSLSNLNLAPGKSIPFTIVFKDLPADLAEYTVEVVDSIPGST